MFGLGFVHLHVHSEYSLLESSSRIEELVSTAEAEHFSSLALTDKGVMYGVIPFYKACRRRGIKPILGMEICLADQYDQTHTRRGHIRRPSLVLLAKSYKGYQQLIQLSSQATYDPFLDERYVSKALLQTYSQDLIAISAGRQGEVECLILEGREDLAKDAVHWYYQVFGDDYYLEVQDHNLSEQKQLNLEISSLAEQLSVPLVASNDVYYVSSADAEPHDCLLCIKHGEKLADQQRHRMPTHEFYLKSEEQMTALFSWLPQALQNTEDIAEKCEVTLTFGQPVLPAFPLPEDISSASYLRQQCERGLKTRYHHVTENIRNRLDYELDIIESMQYCDYFLIVWDFMAFAHEQGILTGPGRGSSAGSIVAYLLHITDVDPIAHRLLFERFLNPERVTMPDIDIDFPDTRREEMIAYVTEKYGSEHVAQIITFGTLAARAAVRDVGRVLDLPYKLIDQLAKKIPNRPGVTLEEARKESLPLKTLLHDSEEAQKLFHIAQHVEGLPRHTSTHAAGVVISREPLTTNVPLIQGHDTLALTQYTMDVLEEIGLLKMDFLGLRNLTLIEDIRSLIEQKTGETIILSDIPLQDDAVFASFRKGETTGIFQFESNGIRQVLQRLKPTTFEDIVAVNALYRPGPMGHISTYIAGKHDETTVSYFHPDLEPILKRTYGVIVYQEQIMQIAAKMAGFSLGEADLLRRAISKKKKHILDQEKEHFVNGSLNKGYPRQTAEQVYDLIVRFADYGFPRSHAVAYSVIAYYLAYLKTYYPQFFMASLLTSAVSSHHKLEDYIRELKDAGMPLYPPSVNDSDLYFTVEKEGIRFGLLAVKNVGIPLAEAMVQERQTTGYVDLYDFCARLRDKGLNRKGLESLILAGGLDVFTTHRASLIASIDQAFDYAEKAVKQAADSQVRLFANHIDKPELIESPPFELAEKLRFEKEALGFYLSAHPLDQFQKVLSQITYQSMKEAQRQANQATVRIAGFVVGARHIKTKKNEPMVFLLLSGRDDTLEVIVFPKIYKKQPAYYEEDHYLLIEGELQKEEQSTKMIARKVKSLEELTPQSSTPPSATLFLKVPSQQEGSQMMKDVKTVLKQHTGATDVVLYYESRRKTYRLPASLRVQPTTQCLRDLRFYLGEENVVLQES